MIEQPEVTTEVKEFPKILNCPHCRRDFEPTRCYIKTDTFFGQVTLSCRSCRRQLWQLTVKDWYEQYISLEKPVDTRSTAASEKTTDQI